MLVALLLLGWALRVPPLLDNRFHADEALYAYWGLLIGQGQDPWLATVPVDKPPLLPYLVAGTQALLGNSEFAVRLPGLAAGWLTIGLTATLSSALYRNRWAATGAAVAVVLSPFAILFSATAFTDPVMVALGLGSCVAAARSRQGWAGLLAGLAFATKQTGLVWVPLVMALMSGLQPRPWRSGPPLLIGDWSLVISHLSFVIFHLSFFISLSLAVGLVFAWDWVRMAQGAKSFWDMGVTAYGSLRPIWPQELWTRLQGWVGLARYFFVSPTVNGVLVAGSALLTWSAAVRRRYTRGALADLFLGAFLLLYLLIHWLFAFPVWDRYFLPLIPVVGLLLGRLVHLASQALGQRAGMRRALIALLAVALACGGLVASTGNIPVGGDHGAYDGLADVMAFLRSLPAGTVLYDRWLSWHYDFYLFDAYVFRAGFPTPEWMARDAAAFYDGRPRYLVLPAWESSARLERVMYEAGFSMSAVLRTRRRDGKPSFVVYQIDERARERGP